METALLFSLFANLFGSAFSLMQRNKEVDQSTQLFHESQDFHREREDLAYQRNLPSSIYQDMISQGFNPNLAAAGIMGSGSSSPASAGGSPSPLPLPSAMSALRSAFGQGAQNIYDNYLKSAQVENIQANTNKTEIEAGILPRDYYLRSLTTTKQLQLWDKSCDKICKEMDYSDEMTKYVKNQNLYYGRMSEAQIKAYQAQVSEACASAMLKLEQINTQKSKQKVNDADIALKSAMTSNTIQQTSNLIVENEGNYYRSERERIAKEFEQNLGGVPLSADAQKMVSVWAENGEYKKIEQFYSVIFQSALNQQIGTAYGTPVKTSIRLPLNLYKSERYKFDWWNNYDNQPYWHPHQ